MRARSWMAALALIGASSLLIGRGLSAQGAGGADDPPPSKGAKARRDPSAADSKTGEKPKSDAPKGSSSRLPKIRLDLRIAGLGGEGCDVEVKPANPSCKFRPTKLKHVDSDGYASIELRDVELRSADKICALAIIVREPGQPPQTIYRPFRTTSTKPGAIPNFTCFISSRLAGVNAKTTRK